jgi:hypothetical protein
MELGYTFKFMRGFTLKTFYFQDYINEIYNQRVKAKQNKDNVMDFIYKLLNSLYGRLEFKMTNFKHTLFQRMFPVLY